MASQEVIPRRTDNGAQAIGTAASQNLVLGQFNLKDVTTSFATTGLIQILNLISGVLLARILLPEGRGELAVILLWPGLIAALGTLGLQEAITFAMAKRSAHTNTIFSTAAVVGLVQSIVLVLIGLWVIEFAMDKHREDVREAARLYFTIVPFILSTIYLLALFRGGLLITQWNISRICFPLVYTLLIPLMYVSGFASVQWFALASWLSYGLPVAGLMVFVFRMGWFGGRPTVATAKTLLGYGLRTHIGASAVILSGKLDQILISIFLSASDFGLFVVAMTVSRAATVMPNTLATLTFPKIAAVKTKIERIYIFGLHMRLALLISSCILVLLYFIAPWAIVFLFGAAFEGSVTIVQVLIYAIIPMSLKLVMIAALKGFGRPLVTGQAGLIELILSAVALAIFLPAFGIIGAAIALLVAQSGSALYLAFRIKVDLGVRVTPLLAPRKDDWELIRSGLQTIISGDWRRP